MRMATFNASAEDLGFAWRNNADWSIEHDIEIHELIHERNTALRTKLSDPSQNQNK